MVIESTTNKPLFSVRSWKSGARCVLFAMFLPTYLIEYFSCVNIFIFKKSWSLCNESDYWYELMPHVIKIAVSL